MGQNDSSLKDDFNTFLATHVKVKDIQKHPRFGEVSIWRDNRDQLVLVKQGLAENKDEFENVQRKVYKRANRNDQFINRLQYKNCFEEQVWCADHYHCYVAYEYYERTLEAEQYDRSKLEEANYKVKYFTEPEIWYILSGLAQALQILANDGINHGDIQPATIFVTLDGGIKLIDLSSQGPKGCGYYRMMMGNENQSALSPQLLECMARREAVPRHNAEKSDIFSLGITILCALTNQRIQNFYIFEKYKCKYDYIAEQLVSLIARGYSKLLVGCIGNMVQEQEVGRPAIGDLIAFINTHSEG